MIQCFCSYFVLPSSGELRLLVPRKHVYSYRRQQLSVIGHRSLKLSWRGGSDKGVCRQANSKVIEISNCDSRPYLHQSNSHCSSLVFPFLKGSNIFCHRWSTVFSSPCIGLRQTDVDFVSFLQDSTSTRAPTAQATAAHIRKQL